jgi:hypothetical protein
MATQRTTEELEQAESPLWLQLLSQWLGEAQLVVEDRSWED